MTASAPTLSLAGRVAIVTGASNGIGRAIATALAGLGARVLGVGRDAGRLGQLAAERAVATATVNLGEPGGCQRAYAVAREQGPVTLLVHAAGRGGYLDRPIFEQSVAEWRETMAVNLDAAFELCRLVAPDIRAAGWGRLILIGSTASELGAPAMAPYCASKHGLLGLMRSVALDIAPHGGTCNAVLPGWVRTEMSERDAEQEAARRGVAVEAVWAERNATNPSGRIATVDEVTQAVLFLAGPAASGINGQAITVARGSVW